MEIETKLIRIRPRFYFSYTPRCWEFGFGLIIGHWYRNDVTKLISRDPSEFEILVGPFSFCFEFGHYIEVVI